MLTITTNLPQDKDTYDTREASLHPLIRLLYIHPRKFNRHHTINLGPIPLPWRNVSQSGQLCWLTLFVACCLLLDAVSSNHSAWLDQQKCVWRVRNVYFEFSAFFRLFSRLFRCSLHFLYRFLCKDSSSTIKNQNKT